MKRVVAAAVLASLSCTAFAQTGASDTRKQVAFEHAQAAAGQNLAARIKILEDVRTCVDGTKDMAGLRTCHQQEHAALKSLYEKAKANRAARKARR